MLMKDFKYFLQLVAAATMFIASKLADPCPITGTELVRYTNDTYNLTELLVSAGRLPGFENFIGWVWSILNWYHCWLKHLFTWYCSKTTDQRIASNNDGSTKS